MRGCSKYCRHSTMATVSSQQALSRGDFRVEFRCDDSPMVCPHSARGWPCLGCVDLRRLGMLRAVVRRPMCQPTWDARACICTHDIENWRAAVLVRAGLVLATSAWQARLPDACAGGVAPSNMTHPDGHSAGSRRAQAHADLSTPSHAYRPERGGIAVHGATADAWATLGWVQASPCLAH